MFKAYYYLLPVNIQNMFSHKEQLYSLRGFGNFVVPIAGSTRRSFSMSVCGVTLWNNLGLEVKQCQSIHHFKRLYKQKVFSHYNDNEV